MTPEMVALDLDGTLIDRALIVTPRVRDAVREALGHGVLVTIVTGRMFVAARPFARELGISVPIVCYQGAAVYDVESGAKLQEVPLPGAVALRIVEQAKRDGLHPQLYHDDRFYVEEYNEFAALYARLAGVDPIVVPSLAEEFAGRDSTKCNIVTTPQRAAEYAPAYREQFGREAYVTRSNPEFIEVMSAQVDKGEALRFVAAREGVAMDRVLAVGDSYNDIPLLRAVGFGVAMGSAPAELKAAADAVVADYAGDGVAEAIERFVLHPHDRLAEGAGT